MEVYVYEEEEVSAEEEQEEDEQKLPRPGNIFVHHDVMLPDFALCELPTRRVFAASFFGLCLSSIFFDGVAPFGEISSGASTVTSSLRFLGTSELIFAATRHGMDGRQPQLRHTPTREFRGGGHGSTHD